MKQVFVAATRQNDGKTLVSLGLFNAFLKRFSHVAYMKPVGQQYRIVNGDKIDKDAVLMQSTYSLKDSLTDMSPIAIPRGFTAKYIESGDRDVLASKVRKAYNRLCAGKDFILIEGTGHAGVGSVFDMSNGAVAKLLGTKVIIVALGGVGRPIDEIMMNKATFDKQGVEVMGAIINKVDPAKYDKISALAEKGLARHGIRVFGTVPLVKMLTRPSLTELVEDLEAEVLFSDGEMMKNSIGKFVIGDMQPHDAVDIFHDHALLIVPGNRDGIIVTGLIGSLLDSHASCPVAGMVFTDGIHPPQKILDLIKKSGIPAMLVQEDSFSVATKINKSIFKLRAEETEKIELSKKLVEQYVDVDAICELL